MEGISDSVLSDRSSELCSVGLAIRTVDEGPPTSVAYELTDAGRALLPALEGSDPALGNVASCPCTG